MHTDCIVPEDYQCRIASIIKAVDARDIDTFITSNPDNIYYLTGYNSIELAPSALLLILSANAKPIFVIRDYNSPLLDHQCGSDAVRYSVADGGSLTAVTLSALRDHGLLAGNIALDDHGGKLPVKTRDEFEYAIPQITTIGGVVENFRSVKSPAEIAFLRKAARFSAIGMAEMVGKVECGNSEAEISAAGYAAMVSAGSEDIPGAAIATAGKRAYLPHLSYSAYRVEEGDHVMIRTCGVSQRYCAPLFHSATAGGNSAAFEDALAQMIDQMAAASERLQPGLTIGAFADACAEVFGTGSAETSPNRFGYSVGIGLIGFDETAVLEILRSSKTPIKPGMCLFLPAIKRIAGTGVIATSRILEVTETGSAPLDCWEPHHELKKQRA